MKRHLITIFFVIICAMSAFGQSASGQNKAREDSIRQLQEVIVTAAKELTRIEGDGMLTRVQGTPLQNTGTVRDLLGYIPGVINNGGSIEVFGRGAPIFYINGRPMRSPQELDQLQSYQIKDIKVINNPGLDTVHRLMRSSASTP